MRIPTIAVSAIAALFALVPAANATPQLVSPAPNATVASSRPALSWTLDEGQDTISIRISSSNTLDENGVLKYPTGKNSVKVSYFPDPTQGESLTSFTPPKNSALPSGRYYWQLQVYDYDQPFVSPVQVFTVRKQTILRTLSASAKAKGQRVTVGLLHVVNAREIKYSLVFKRGRTKVGSTVKGTFYNSDKIGSPTLEKLAFRPVGFTLRKGDAYSVTAKITADGITRTKVKTFRVS